MRLATAHVLRRHDGPEEPGEACPGQNGFDLLAGRTGDDGEWNAPGKREQQPPDRLLDAKAGSAQPPVGSPLATDERLETVADWKEPYWESVFYYLPASGRGECCQEETTACLDS